MTNEELIWILQKYPKDMTVYYKTAEDAEFSHPLNSVTISVANSFKLITISCSREFTDKYHTAILSDEVVGK